MRILLPGFVEPSRIYKLAQQRSGELTLELIETVSGATLKTLMDNHLPPNQTILVDSGYPEIINELKDHGFHAIGGRL